MTAHSSRAHAKLSPSAAHRWAACPGSIRMSEGIPNKSSIHADEGTAAHTLAEKCLRDGSDPIEWLGGYVDIHTGAVAGPRADGNPARDGCFTVDEEMVDAVQLYIDTVRERVDAGDEVEYEARLDLRHIPGMEFGTGDCVIFKPESQHLFVIDLKYGRGVPVDVKSNEQLRAYALGAAKRFHNRGVLEITTIIVQPRCPHPDGPVRSETIDAVDLVEFRMDLEEKALATQDPDAPLVPGDHCKFCPAAATCPALRERVLAVAEMEFSPAGGSLLNPGVPAPGEERNDKAPPSPGNPSAVDGLTPDEMADILREAGVIKDWLKRVEERAHDMAKRGQPPTGFKLVASRATRKWRDEDEAARFLVDIVSLDEDDVFTEPKMKSPAQIEKMIGRRRYGEISDLVVSRSSGSILVPVEDPRPPVRADAEEEFG